MATTTNKAQFRVVGNTTSPSTARGYSAVPGEVLAFQLEDSTGVLSALWETYDPASPSSPLATLNAPSFPFTGSSLPAFSNGVSPFAAAATVPTPSGGQPLSNSYFVRCTVVTAAGSQTWTRSINATNGVTRKPVPGESTENSLRGWADDWAALIESTTLHGVLQPSDGIHGIVSALGPYASVAARRAAVLTSADAGKCALQTDTTPPTMWTVLSVSSGVGSWGLIATAEATFSGDFGAIFAAGAGLTLVTQYQGWNGLTKTGSIVNGWANQGGNAGNATEGTSTVGIGTATAGLNGHAAVAANGSTQFGKYNTAANLAAPATTNYHKYFIYRSLATTGAQQHLDSTSGFVLSTLQGASLADIEMYGGSTVVSDTATANTWARMRQSFTGSVSDELKWGNRSVVTGTSAGNAGAGGTLRGLFATEAGSAFANHELLLHITVIGPKAAFLTQAALADAQLDAYFGAGAVQH